MKIVVTRCAAMLLPEYQRTGGATGYVCAQVNPSRTGNRVAMLEMARRFHKWAPNIAVKLPGALSGLDAEEDCIAEGITTTITVSFTVPQVLAIAERHRSSAVTMTAVLDDAGRGKELDPEPGAEATGTLGEKTVNAADHDHGVA